MRTELRDGQGLDAGKRALRAQVRAALAARSAPELAAWSLAAQARLQALPAYAAARHVALYLAMAREPGTADLLADCRARGVRVSVPAFDAAAGVYRLGVLPAAGAIGANRHGVPEPAAVVWLGAGDPPDLVVVPGVAFDACGNRLGRGGGFYDRILAGLRAAGRPWVAGFAFALQCVDRVPVAPHDVPVDFVVTETTTRNCAEARGNMEDRTC